MDEILPADITPAYARDVPPDRVREKLMELLGIETLPDRVDFEAEASAETEDDLVVTRYLDGDLPAGERGNVVEHLERCPACTERLRVLQSLTELVGPAEEVPLPPSLLGKLTAIPDRAPARPRAALYLLAAAGVAAAVMSAFGAWVSEQIPRVVLLRMFACLMILVGVKYLFQPVPAKADAPAPTADAEPTE